MKGKLGETHRQKNPRYCNKATAQEKSFWDKNEIQMQKTPGPVLNGIY